MVNFMEDNADSEIYSNELKKQAGFGKDGEKGFDGAITNLMMQTYLCNCDFKKRVNKRGEYDDEVLRSKEKEIIDRIAVVNVKKSNGGSESEYEDLKKYALEDRLEIKRELEIIQPDIIVCGNNLSLLKLVLGEELQNDDTWDNMLALWKDTLVLDYYHPAVHYPNRVNYYALMAICDVARKKYGTPVWSEQNEKY